MELIKHRKFPIGTRVLIVTALLSLLLFGAISWLVVHEQISALDKMVASCFGNPTRDGIAFMVFITFFGSSQFMVGCYILLALFLLFRKKNIHALVSVTTGLTGYFIVYYLKKIFRRPRPDYQLIEPMVNFSFPSGHACSGLILYGILIYMLWRRSVHKSIKIILTTCLLAFAFFIGITRIYLGVHYASDVLAGFFLGYFFLCMTIITLDKVEPKILQIEKVKE
jgi:membrane-associated phospholipid phosphatase